MSFENDFQKLLLRGIKKAGGKQKLAIAIGVRNGTITQWVQGNLPIGQNLRKLTEYLARKK